MTAISRITTQKKFSDRYNVFLDDGHGETYGFSVDEAVLVAYRLHKHMELDEATIETLIQQDTLHKHYNQAINFLSYRMRTKQEMYNYLVQKEVDDEQIKQIMDKLVNEALLDDRQFAETFVRTRCNTTDKGPKLIEQELAQKGVDHTLAAEAVSVYTFDVQFTKAKQLATKKFSTGQTQSFQQKIQRMQRSLAQKGFTGDVIQAVTAAFQDEQDDEAEWEALLKQGSKLYRKHQRKYSGLQFRQKMQEALYRKGFTLDLINQFLENDRAE